MPLGKYQELVTALLTVFLVVAAVGSHIAGVPDTTFLDSAALLALGATYGRISAANGYAKQAQAANTRLDKIGAPAAADPTPAPPLPAGH